MSTTKQTHQKFTPEEAKKYWDNVYWTLGLEDEEITIISECGQGEVEVLKVHIDFFEGDWQFLSNPRISDVIISKKDFEIIKKLMEV